MNMRQWSEAARSSLNDLIPSATDYLSRLLVALLLLAIGWLIAKLLSVAARKVVERIESLLRNRTGVDRAQEHKVGSQMVSVLTFWVVFLFFLAGATEQLRLPVVAQALSKLAGYIPAALASVVILLAALILADIARRAVTSAAAASGLSYAEVLGNLSRGGILLIASVIALDQLGVNSTILVTLTVTLFAAVLGGATLAFALGARTMVANILASHYVLQTYRPGQTIRVEDITGRIVDIRPAGVVLDAPEGQVVIPASAFQRSISMLVREDA